MITITPNDEPAATMTRDGLGFVSTTTPRPRRKDRDYAYVHDDGARVHC